MLTQFVAAFDDIVIGRFNRNREEKDRINVRYVYAPKQRVLYDIINENKTLTLPVVSVNVTGVSRDETRVFNKLDGFYYQGEIGNDKVSRHIKPPIPVNINLSVSILTRYQTDMDQIISNFVPFCNPYVVVSWKLPEEFSLSVDQEIRSEVLWNGDVNLSYPTELNGNQKARVTGDTSFVIKGWLFKDTADPQGNIFYIDNNFHLETDILEYDNFESLSGNDYTDRIETISISGNPQITGIFYNNVLLEQNLSLSPFASGNVILNGYSFDHTTNVLFSTNNETVYKNLTTIDVFDRQPPISGEIIPFTKLNDNIILINTPSISAGKMSFIPYNVAGYDNSAFNTTYQFISNVQAQVLVNLNSELSAINSIEVINAGKGYLTVPDLSIESPTSQQQQISAETLINNGEIAGFNITNPGLYYRELPSITVTTPSLSNRIPGQFSSSALNLSSEVVSGSFAYNLVKNQGFSEHVNTNFVYNLTSTDGTFEGIFKINRLPEPGSFGKLFEVGGSKDQYGLYRRVYAVDAFGNLVYGTYDNGGITTPTTHTVSAFKQGEYNQILIGVDNGIEYSYVDGVLKKYVSSSNFVTRPDSTKDTFFLSPSGFIIGSKENENISGITYEPVNGTVEHLIVQTGSMGDLLGKDYRWDGYTQNRRHSFSRFYLENNPGNRGGGVLLKEQNYPVERMLLENPLSGMISPTSVSNDGAINANGVPDSLNISHQSFNNKGRANPVMFSLNYLNGLQETSKAPYVYYKSFESYSPILTDKLLRPIMVEGNNTTLSGFKMSLSSISLIEYKTNSSLFRDLPSRGFGYFNQQPKIFTSGPDTLPSEGIGSISTTLLSTGSNSFTLNLSGFGYNFTPKVTIGQPDSGNTFIIVGSGFN